jgi:hypothetical protein
MSNPHRITSSFFTALPSLYFFIQAVFLTSRAEYYWKTDVVVASVLLVSSLLLGFVLPLVFQLFRIRAAWVSILTGGLLAMGFALFAMTLLNATPLCVGQDSGDGNNDLGMCMGYVALAGIVFGAVYLFFLAISAFFGHWVLKVFQL